MGDTCKGTRNEFNFAESAKMGLIIEETLYINNWQIGTEQKLLAEGWCQRDGIHLIGIGDVDFAG